MMLLSCRPIVPGGLVNTVILPCKQATQHISVLTSACIGRWMQVFYMVVDSLSILWRLSLTTCELWLMLPAIQSASPGAVSLCLNILARGILPNLDYTKSTPAHVLTM